MKGIIERIHDCLEWKVFMLDVRTCFGRLQGMSIDLLNLLGVKAN